MRTLYETIAHCELNVRLKQAAHQALSPPNNVLQPSAPAGFTDTTTTPRAPAEHQRLAGQAHIASRQAHWKDAMRRNTKFSSLGSTRAKTARRTPKRLRPTSLPELRVTSRN